MLTLTLVSIHGMMGRIYAIEQPSTMEGINEEECDKVVNCKIISENVLKDKGPTDWWTNSKFLDLLTLNYFYNCGYFVKMNAYVNYLGR